MVYATPINKLIPSGIAITDQMYSLTDIYNLATEGTSAGTKDGVFVQPDTISPGPGGTGYTLHQVYDAVAGAITIPPTFASADIASYNCSWFTTMQDDTQSPSPSSEDICNFNPGCTWDIDTCTGGTVTSLSLGNGAEDPLYMTWYAGKAACENYSEIGQPEGAIWRLPTSSELHLKYLDSHGTPDTFIEDVYRSGTILPGFNGAVAYYVVMVMNDGSIAGDGKDASNILTRCAR